MAKIGDVSVVVGTYINRDGKEQYKWKTVGALITGAGGKQYIMLDKSFNPAGAYCEAGKEGSDQIVMSIFPPKDNNSGGGNGQQGNDNPPRAKSRSGYTPPDDIGDDIPF